jgi:hypothetical protein
MTITLEDVAMLFGLRVDGYAVTGHINPQDWRDIVEALLGVRPDEPQEGVKDRKTTGVNSSWLVQHFGHRPPPHANALQIQMYARAQWRSQEKNIAGFNDNQTEQSIQIALMHPC